MNKKWKQDQADGLQSNVTQVHTRHTVPLDLSLGFVSILKPIHLIIPRDRDQIF